LILSLSSSNVIDGIFGVDTIKDGKCPDGIDYDWNKKSRIGRVKKERV